MNSTFTVDTSTRSEMIRLIYTELKNYAQRRHKQIPEERLILSAKHIELSLLRNAESRDEYLDVSTLRRRMILLLRDIVGRNRNGGLQQLSGKCTQCGKNI